MDKTIKQIDEKLRRLETQRARHIKSKIVPSIVKQMRQNGITPNDIVEAWNVRGAVVTPLRRKTSPLAAGPRQAKYKNPHSDETWSGVGKRPFWLRDAEQAGHHRDEFLIRE